MTGTVLLSEGSLSVKCEQRDGQWWIWSVGRQRWEKAELVVNEWGME